MHKLDPHSLFSIFEQGDEEIYKEHNVEELLQNPYVLVGMVVNGIENFHLIDKMYMLKHGEEYDRVRENIQLKYFTRMYNYLNRVTPVELDTSYTIGSDFEVERALKAILHLLYFFEQLEHYEKCAKIKQYSELLVNKKLQSLI